jgi:glycosyltransferase involved in cell wall biosynthesis
MVRNGVRAPARRVSGLSHAQQTPQFDDMSNLSTPPRRTSYDDTIGARPYGRDGARRRRRLASAAGHGTSVIEAGLERMRVTVICSVFPPAPAAEAVHAALLCENLAKAGHEVTLITSEGVDVSTARHDGYDLHAVMPGWRWRDVFQLRRQIADTRPDVVLLVYLGWLYDNKHPMITYLPTICRSLPTRPRVIVQFENTAGHAEIKGIGQRIGRRLSKMIAGAKGLEFRYGTLLRDCDGVIALCDPHIQRLEKVDKDIRRKTKVIPAPPLLREIADPDGAVRRRKRAEIGAADDDFVVAYFGDLYPMKGVETLIEAMNQTAKAAPHAKLLIIGGTLKGGALNSEAYADGLREKVRELGLADRTFWAGHLEGEDASAYLRAADCAVLPFVEGVRLNNSSYAVATSHGLPVVTTKRDALEADFVDGHNLLVCKASDADDMSRAITAVANDAALRDRLRAGSNEYSRGRSSWEAVVRQTVEFCREVAPGAHEHAASQTPPAAAAVN